MKKKMHSKKIVAAMLATMMVLVTGCGGAEDNSEASNTEEQAGATTEAVTTTSEKHENESTAEEVTTDATEVTEDATENTDTSSATDIMTTKGFVPLSQAVESYVFEKEENEESMFIYADSTYRGEYRLCSDAKDIIVVDFDYDMYEGYVEVNGVKETFGATAISNVAIVDVDKSDPYKEIVIYDEGPSDDPTIILFRYCNGELYKLGEFYGRYNYDYILFDQKGKIISAEGYISFLDIHIVSEYFEVEGNEAVSVPVDISGALNQKYRVSNDISVAFKASENEYYELDNPIVLKAGDEIVLIEAYEDLIDFYIELPDGTRGYITTQLAG